MTGGYIIIDSGISFADLIGGEVTIPGLFNKVNSAFKTSKMMIIEFIDIAGNSCAVPSITCSQNVQDGIAVSYDFVFIPIMQGTISPLTVRVKNDDTVTIIIID